ncbi:MAG: threonine--tRNA ligase [Candidatus Nitrosoabyssus spongiisocia]|nr:MAG: threonine--tRNA ligase [Nitrosopumilaceae archaeon AB1(1)]
MQILAQHCDSIQYLPIKQEIKIADNIEPKEVNLQDLVVAFISVESGDDNSTAKTASHDIIAYMQKLGCTRLLLYPFAHLSSNLAKPSAVLPILDTLMEHLSEVETHKAPFGWNKSYTIKVKGHPLAEHSIHIVGGIPDREPDSVESSAMASESKLSSSWYILTPEGIMIPVSDFNFAKYTNLEKLAKYESLKKRGTSQRPPHIELMRRLSIAGHEPASDQGNIRFYPNGRLIKSQIERYVTERVKKYGGYEVETPIMYDVNHPALLKYFNRFPARQYNITSDNKSLFLRFAACFGQFLMAHDFQMSYKNLPYRLYELTRYSFRREQSGELVGLKRLRAFTMPDCHAFCRDLPQAISEIEKRFDLSQDVLNNLGIAPDKYEMAVRLTHDFYNDNKTLVNDLVKKHGKPILVEMWDDKFFYFVLKWEFNYIDEFGKASALSTDQIDVENGDLFGIKFIDENNNPQTPLILHNSPSGAIERVIFVLLEMAAQDAKRGTRPQLPLWMAPTQVRLIPLSENFVDFCDDLANKLSHENIRVDLDDRIQSIGKRIRDAEREWVRYLLVIGDKEVSSDDLSVRDRTSGNILTIKLDDFIKKIQDEIGDKPRVALNQPRLLSMRPQTAV